MLTRYERFIASIAGISRCIQKIETDEMKKYSLKGSHAQFLVALSQNPEGVTAAQLCGLCDKDKAAVSRAIAELEERGLLRREGGAVYRARLLLTDQGKKLARIVCHKVESAVRLAEAEIDEEQSRELFEILTHIAGGLQSVCKNGLPE